jgi:PAS domain S-box-containing protein
MIPGVEAVRNMSTLDLSPFGANNVERYPLKFGGSTHGDIVIKLRDEVAYKPYSPHIQNLLFVIGVMLEERRQRKLTETHRRELEQRVLERTEQLQQEVTERRHAELLAISAMRRAEDYLTIAEAIIVELDRDARITVINKRGCDLLGYSPEELVGKDWFELTIPKSDIEIVRDAFEKMISDGMNSVEYFDNAVLTRTGEVRYVRWHNTHRRENGVVVGTLSSGVDITEYRKSQSALAAEKEQLDVTLRSIGDGVITTDIQGRILIMNSVAEQLTGVTFEEARGRSITSVLVLVDDRTQKVIEPPITQTLTEPKTVELAQNLQLISKDKTKRSIAVSFAKVKDREAHVLGVVVVIRDMTERNRLIEQTQRAERLDAIGVLAGGIAHDFNNLLSGIFGNLCLARELSADQSPQAIALDDALQVYERARDLTKQLLTFSKGGAPVRSVVDLRKLLSDCARFALSGSKVASRLNFADTLPNVAVDANQIWRVIDNLIRNAVQAMPNGGTVEIYGDCVEPSDNTHPNLKRGKYVRVTVRDDGPGIPQNTLPKIFDPFFTTKEHGNGLGLATAYSVVRKHDGHIEVESELGKGTTFRIYLPVVVPRSVTPVPSKKLVGHVGSGRALVLDDEPYLCQLFERYLTRMGYQVSVARSGHDALLLVDQAILEGKPFKVALLDLTIPGGMGGKDTIAVIRPKLPDLIAIASSGYSEDPVMAHPTDYGFTASIGKPFALPELAALLDYFSGQHTVSTK